jgi:ribosomal protein S18 acetylase RimI-like enzyme
MLNTFNHIDQLQIIIDHLKSEELQSLKELYEDGFEGSKTDLDSMLKTFDLIKDNANYHILNAKINGNVVGSVMGVVCYELFGKCLPFMVVENVVVSSAYRRRGIARQLLMALEEIAKQEMCTTVLFVSSAHRAGAHKLYESLGYGDDKVNGYRKRL